MPLQDSPDWLKKQIELFYVATGFRLFFSRVDEAMLRDLRGDCGGCAILPLYYAATWSSCGCGMARQGTRKLALDLPSKPAIHLLWIPVEAGDTLFGLLYTEAIRADCGQDERDGHMCEYANGLERLRKLFHTAKCDRATAIAPLKLQALSWLMKLTASDLSRRFQDGQHAPEPTTPAEALVRRAEAILQEEFRNAISTHDVAEKLRVSESHLCHAFQAVKGATLLQRLNDLRFQDARRLLVEYPRLSVAEIAFATGFQSLSRFNEQFRRRHQTSPGKWRRMQI